MDTKSTSARKHGFIVRAKLRPLRKRDLLIQKRNYTGDFLYSPSVCRFTAVGTMCFWLCFAETFPVFSLGCRRLRIMGILAKVFTPNVDFSRSHGRAFMLKDVLSPYPQVRSAAAAKTGAEKHRNGDSVARQLHRNFQFVLSRGPFLRRRP